MRSKREILAKPASVAEYLSAVSDDKRAALVKLRRDIMAAAPRAEECISYQLPAFRLDGRFLVAFGASARHCAFYPGSAPIEACKSELRPYGTSKGTIRFQADKPLPTPLVRKLVKVRLEQLARSAGVRAGVRRR